MEELYYRIEEAAFTLRDYAKRLSFDPARMEALEERLELLGRLKRKYGGTLDAVLAKQAEAEEELRNIASVEEEIEKLLTAIADEKATDDRSGGTPFREGGMRWPLALQETIEKEIRTLRMENARFEVVFREPPGGGCGLHGKGDGRSGVLPLGERGRGAEAAPGRLPPAGSSPGSCSPLKKVLARTGSVGTIVFDEVDSGIGGATAEIVGQKLREVSRHHQVLCITHLPQIACCGDRHYRVVKRIAGERTNTSVAVLSEEERLEEIARMLGGVELTEKTREHAREMLRAARG